MFKPKVTIVEIEPKPEFTFQIFEGKSKYETLSLNAIKFIEYVTDEFVGFPIIPETLYQIENKLKNFNRIAINMGFLDPNTKFLWLNKQNNVKYNRIDISYLKDYQFDEIFATIKPEYKDFLN